MASFKNRDDELRALESWWAQPRLRQMLLYGRRRVGKSWLFRRFAHGKPAVIMVVRSESAGAQFEAFAEALEPFLGVTPRIQSPGELIRMCYRAGQREKVLVVVDEFQNLLPARDPRKEAQKDIQAVMEEEQDESELRLVICGSAVRTMEELLDEGNPLHGRFHPMLVGPMPYSDSRAFLDDLETPAEKIERYAISGGTPQYLELLGNGPVRDVVVTQAVNRFGYLHDEITTLLSQELRDLRTYFAILRQLSTGDRVINEIAQGVSRASRPADISPHLEMLAELQLIRRTLPIGAQPSSHGRHSLVDPFARFWFRFIFPFQQELDAGLDPVSHYRAVIEPALAEHVSPVFEEVALAWVRTHHAATAQRVGAWWGPSAKVTRRVNPDRLSEEIDVVGLKANTNTVTLVGECKWQNAAMDTKPLTELRTFKIPALRESGFKIAPSCKILLFAKSGFRTTLTTHAGADSTIELIDVSDLECW